MGFGYAPAVSKPRQILAKSTYLITRRTILRHMLLRPDRRMTRMIIYHLAVAAKRHGLQVHAFCAMSTHLHLVVTDVRGNLSEFLQAFHLVVARCTKALRDWDGPVWDKDPTSVVRLETEAAVIEKIAYVLANPVAAGLVRRAHHWPGAKVLVGEIGKAKLCAPRPDVYLNPENEDWPAEATLPISLPPSIERSAAGSFRRKVAAELERLEAQAHAQMQEARRTFLGADQACKVSPTARATTPEPKVDRNPTFAVGRSQRDAWQRAVTRVRSFRKAYQAALEQWCAEVRDVVFPAGTWWMRVFHGAVVADEAVT